MLNNVHQSRLNVLISVNEGIDGIDDEHMAKLRLGSRVVSKGQATVKIFSNIKTKDTKKNNDTYVPDDTDLHEIKKVNPQLIN